MTSLLILGSLGGQYFYLKLLDMIFEEKKIIFFSLKFTVFLISLYTALRLNEITYPKHDHSGHLVIFTLYDNTTQHGDLNPLFILPKVCVYLYKAK